MLDKVRNDYNSATDYIEENYGQVKIIFNFMKTFEMPNWEEGNVTFE